MTSDQVRVLRAAIHERPFWVEHRPLNFGASWEAPSIREPPMNTFDHSSREP